MSKPITDMTDYNRRSAEALSGVLAALQAEKNGEGHPRLLTPARKAQIAETDRLRRIALSTSRYPVQPRIIVTQPMEDWRDYRDERRGRGGAVRQE